MARSDGGNPVPDTWNLVKAEAPLSAMFGYIGDLRTMTSGRSQFSMEFSHYPLFRLDAA